MKHLIGIVLLGLALVTVAVTSGATQNSPLVVGEWYVMVHEKTVDKPVVWLEEHYKTLAECEKQLGNVNLLMRDLADPKTNDVRDAEGINPHFEAALGSWLLMFIQTQQSIPDVYVACELPGRPA
jgi:hypothetical protein